MRPSLLFAAIRLFRRPGRRRRLRRVRRRVAIAAGALVVVSLLIRPARLLRTAMGAGPRAIRSTPALSAPSGPSAQTGQYLAGRFHNSTPTTTVIAGSTKPLLRALVRRLARPAITRPPGVVPIVREAPATVSADLAVTWFGHASVLLEVDGHRLLADPVWGKRVSPSERIGPARLHPAPLPLEDLPHLDAILISHDHYDHLDLPTVRGLLDTQDAPFCVPVGVGAHLRRWKVPEDRIIELDWEQQAPAIGALRLTCTQTRHFSGRGLRRNTTLWCSWAIAGPRHRVYFGGDTGYTPAFADLGRRHGPFDLTLLPVGAYSPQWPDIHLDPEEAVRAHRDLGGHLLVPIHWATFDLAFHPWAEPADRLVAAARTERVDIRIPRPGERLVLDPAAPSTLDEWWKNLTRP